jgi:hypothetical protein
MFSRFQLAERQTVRSSCRAKNTFFLPDYRLAAHPPPFALTSRTAILLAIDNWPTAHEHSHNVLQPNETTAT